MGFFALYSNASGSYNIAIDNNALQNNTTSNNLAIGNNAAMNNTTDKKALNFRVNGMRSGFIDSTSTNTIFGYGALQNVTSGLTNTVVGYASSHFIY